ncbi:ArsC/Spx/MgsR family protein [Campylobacter cuniculorum]|uniref:ArsC/Spx/MgsR family protein n=1 Tax=Campylobacter cuniculorum TaxID=374106 RepID=UPI0023F032D3|nr:ArsC/Spx/MgsR family protein [Campylobacter cuniculorum]
MKLYGIKNCNSVKKAMIALEKFNFEFLDIKRINKEILSSWLKQKTFEELINTNGTTARKLALTKDKLKNLNEEELKNLILENPSIIKRPVVEFKNEIFVSKEYEKLL